MQTHRLHVGIRPRHSVEAVAAKRAYAKEHGRPTSSSREPACACGDDGITVSADDPDVAAMLAGTSDTQHRIYDMRARGAEFQRRQVVQGIHAEDDPGVEAMTAGEAGHQEHLRQAREDQKVNAREAKLRWPREKKRHTPASSGGEHFPDQEPAAPR